MHAFEAENIKHTTPRDTTPQQTTANITCTTIVPVPVKQPLTHRGRLTHICVSQLSIIGSDNGLSPGRRLAIIWTNASILMIRTLDTNFCEILSEINTFSFKKMHLKMSS